jgi:hypothetical protein
LKEGRNIEGISQENIPKLVAMTEMKLDSCRKELLSTIEASVSKARLVGGYGISNMMSDLSAFRRSGKVSGIDMSGVDELADVLENFLQAAGD